MIFDHLPKTAGMAVTDWLRSALGDGCVKGGLIKDHQAVIRNFGGQFSLISAHLTFTGEGLDPRYDYVTFFRHPVDRALSWIYYVLNNYSDSDIKELRCNIKRFLDTEGEEGNEFIGGNYYVTHLCSVYGNPIDNADYAVQCAMDVLEEYTLWGLYERMPDFLMDFAAYLSVPAPMQLVPVNVTRERKKMDEISPTILARLKELNALDLEFYLQLQSQYDRTRARWHHPTVTESNWLKLEMPVPRRNFDSDFILLAIRQTGGSNVNQHAILSFEVEFSLARPVEILECGIHVLDESEAWAFGTNTTLSKTPIGPVAAGTHCVQYSIVANLPERKYEVGFAFMEKLPAEDKLLAWINNVAFFQISLSRELGGVGYSSLPAAINSWTVSTRVATLVEEGMGSVRFSAGVSQVVVGECWKMPIVIRNESNQDWLGTYFHPINVSYHWLSENGVAVLHEGLRSTLPNSQLGAAQKADVSLEVQAPERPARYRLQVLPVQELHAWLDEKGFVPGEAVIEVVPPRGRRLFKANDCRLRSHVGRLTDTGLFCESREGFLVFGPYVPLAAGCWHVVWRGEFNPAGGDIRVEAVSGGGVMIHGELTLEAGPVSEIVLKLPLTVDLEDAEFRLWIDAKATAELTEIELIPFEMPSVTSPESR